MSEVYRITQQVAPSRACVLIVGETGTGKELIARAIHFGGVYAKRPFVAVDCGSLVPTLIESELFGYEKGAFTGALRTKAGLFQAADGGTIFLDEIGELPMEMQAKMLRVLQEKEVRPVGSNQRFGVDVRVIAATNRDLETAYKAGTFRKDLYFRLNVVTVHLAALRERKSDIPTLVRWFLSRLAPNRGMQVSNTAMNCLLNYEWPGNVRELENCIERAVTLGNETVIDVADLPPSIQGGSTVSAVDRATPLPVSARAGSSSIGENGASSMDLEEMERATIQRVFDQVGGDKNLAREILGISRATLYRKIKRYNIRIGAQAAAAVAH
jgi:transcriptional regulator with PAS, ATPase and Fis domain